MLQFPPCEFVQVATMPAEQLQIAVVVGPARFEQAEAVRRGAEDGGEIGYG